MHSPRWLSYFTDAVRQVEGYRAGRVLLAGDAAHIHLPAGGQGINMGMQDAFNLGWKLAAVLRGDATDTLLDTYHDERYAADADILKMVRAQSVLFSLDPRTADLVEVMTRLVGFDEGNRYLSTTMSGLTARYRMPGGHPMLGCRVPDADISTRGTDKRIFELLRGARPVLLDMSRAAGLADAAAGWADRIDIVVADCPSPVWELPGAGTIPAPAALLIRPDGHVVWASDRDPDLVALHEALDTWCGPASKTGVVSPATRPHVTGS
jgi:3-(3-hydroxy-phenyl)propionate hydroxylase